MNGCKFCDKKGLLILPLRYAAVVGEPASKALPAMPSTLGERVSDLTLQYAKYAPRLMRSGYLYVLIKRNSATYWEGYAINDDAYLYKFPVEEPPRIPVVFSCDGGTCGIDASMISVDKVEFVKKIYLLFTPCTLTPAKLAEYKANADSYVEQGKMQAFDPKAWTKETRNQKHSLKPDLLDNHVVEFMLYQQDAAALSSPLGVGMRQQLFPALQSAYAGVAPLAPGEPKPGRLGGLQFKMEKIKAAAFAVFDHIGITQELNDWRNSALEKVERYLMETDQYGISNQHKMQVYEAIAEIKAALKHGVAQTSEQFREDHRQQSDRYWERLLATARMLRSSGRADDAQRIENDVAESLKKRQVNYAKLIEDGKSKADAQWREKYESRIDVNEMNNFHQTLKDHTAKAFAEVEARARDHLMWFEADRLVDAFDVFDPANLPSGHDFAVQSALCTFGLDGCKLANSKLDAWSSALTVQRKNLYLRGIYYNQTELFAAARIANEEIQASVATVEYASDVTSGHMIKATKALVDSFDKIDSAYDEWCRNQGQGFRFLKNELQLYHWVSGVTRTVFRKGLGGTFDKTLTARLSGLLYARIGKLATKLEYDALMLRLPKEEIRANASKRAKRRAEGRHADKVLQRAAKEASAINNSLEALIADAQSKQQAKVKLTLGEVIGNDKVPINNYHQTRIGVLMGCIEMIALGEKLTHFEYGTKGYLGKR